MPVPCSGRQGGTMEYRCVTNLQELQDYLGKASLIAFDFETAPREEYRQEEKAALDAHKADIAGVSFSVSEGTAVYVPLRHKTRKNAGSPDKIMQWLTKSVFENKGIVKIAHNLSFEAMFLYALGVVLQPPCYDTIAAAQMTLKSNTAFRTLADSGLKTLTQELYGVELPSFETVTAGRYFDELDPQDEETVRYACADSDYTLRLYHLFNNWFDRYLPKHRSIVEQVESPAAVYCGLMKYNGLLADEELMRAKQEEAEGKLAELRENIAFMIGDVNIGANASTSAFKKYLYDDLKLPVFKTTAKYQEAMDDEAMILLSEWCRENRPELAALFEMVQEYRRWGKIKSTYIDGYLEHIDSVTGRIHPDMFPLGTETGRFAARNPNLQNCFDDQTEILTTRGFIPFSDLTPEDCVAQWENGEIEFVYTKEIIEQDYAGNMIRISNQHIDLCMTPDHRCLLQNRKNRQYFVVPASEYCGDSKQLHAGQYRFGDKRLSAAEITLLAATQADGFYHDSGIDFKFSKARKYRRLIQAIKAAGIPYSDYVCADGRVNIRLQKSDMTIWIMDILGSTKTWSNKLLEFDRQTVKGILTEIVHWDGCFTRSNHYSSSVKQNADWMQILNILTGSRANLREYHNGNPNSAVNYQLDVTDRNYSLTTNVKKVVVPYTGKVYCVSVPSGFIVVRRSGKVCITGNCPRKDNDPVGVRNFFIAPKGKALLSLDFSQIELRVGAFYCRDERMLETYRTGGDIHAQTTSVIYRIPFGQAADKNAEHYKERRAIAKNCNFGVFYGLFPKGLQRNLKFKAGLNTPLAECERIIENLKSGYPRLARWQEETKKRAASRRYTETWLGRRRYLPDIASADWGKKSFAERCALNTPIQGTAADILKLALGRIIEGLPRRLWLRPLLQIHDELVFELPEDKVREVAAFVKACMEAQPFEEFDVPVVAEAASGERFGELKELDTDEIIGEVVIWA